MKTKADLIQYINENGPRFTAISDAIWERPEPQHREFFASRLQADFLEKEGFQTQWEVGGLRTAFISEWGTRKPIIGFIGEFDALAGLSQKCQPTPEPVEPGGWGHGCGHNLLGTGGLAAAWLSRSGWKIPALRARCATTAARPKKTPSERPLWRAPAHSMTWMRP